ncbi:MAG: NMD3-related protein [Candidatus Micrarchaeota archaeon]
MGNLKACPSCGSKEKQFVGAFCMDCFSKQQLVEVQKKNLEFVQCPKCGRVKKAGEWVAFDERMVRELVEKKSKSAFPLAARVSYSRDKNFLLVKAVFDLNVDGARVLQEKRLEIPVVKTMCLQCNRESGGYKEAIIQLRGDEQKVEKALLRLQYHLSGKTFWKAERKKTGGVDVIAGSKTTALNAVRQLKKSFSLSHKLMGVRAGKRLFLVTVLVRV